MAVQFGDETFSNVSRYISDGPLFIGLFTAKRKNRDWLSRCKAILKYRNRKRTVTT